MLHLNNQLLFFDQIIQSTTECIKPYVGMADCKVTSSELDKGKS